MGPFFVRGGLVLLVGALFIADAQAGPIGEGDFGPETVLQTFDGFGLPIFVETPIAFGDGTYTSDGFGGTLRYLPVGEPPGVSGFSGDAVGEGFSFLDVVFGTPVQRAGATMGTITDWTAQADFFDEQDTLLGTVEKSGLGGQGVFAGWEADSGLIRRIRFTRSESTNFIIAIDNLLTEAPLPDLPVSLFTTGFEEVAPTITVFESQVLTVTTLIHLVPSDPALVSQATLDAKAIEWGNEIDDVWNTGNPFQIEDASGFSYDIEFEVLFVDQAFIDANGDALVTTVTVHATTPPGGVNTLNWAVGQPVYTAAHEYGHIGLGLLDAYAGASPVPMPPPEPDGLDDEALMGALVPVLRPWYMDNLLDYFAGLGIDVVLSGAPPDGMSGEAPDETVNTQTEPAGHTYIVPEPTALALLALGVGLGALMRRRA